MKPTLIPTLQQLITQGEVPTADLASLPTGQKIGLWHPLTTGKTSIATPTLLHLLRTLPTPQEAIAAILSCEPDLRPHWLRIARARLQELQPPDLIEAITTLDQAAPSLLTITTPSLNPTPHTELERTLLSVPAEQAIATPKLYRILGATAPLLTQPTAYNPLPPVDLIDPTPNWLKTRLIQPPSPQPSTAIGILSGSYADYTPPTPHPPTPPSPHLSTLYWILARPWCFLLAQIVFTQEAWAAERISGSLTLELERNHLPLAHQPPKISLIVTLPDGSETLCGSLGELLQRLLNALGIAILAPSLDTLDSQLAPLIDQLLQRQVWQFSPGDRSLRPHYTIHPTFSDTCYRAIGSKYFNRLASNVTAAIRSSSEQWAREQWSREQGSREQGARERLNPAKSLTLSHR